MQIRFTATKMMAAYEGPIGVMVDGQTRDVPDSEAERLRDTFPDNFTIVETTANTAAGDAPANMMQSGSRKRK